jgi:hypothetical protein
VRRWFKPRRRHAPLNRCRRTSAIGQLPKIRFIKRAAAHLTDQAGFVGRVVLQPLRKELFDFNREAKQDVDRIFRTSQRCGFQHAIELPVVESRITSAKRTETGTRASRNVLIAASSFFGWEARGSNRCIKPASSVVTETVIEASPQAAIGADDIQIAGDQIGLRNDAERVTKYGENLQILSRQSAFSLDWLVGIRVGSERNDCGTILWVL